MSRPPSCQSTPQFYRISDKDLTEIELHSVDSINDLHRTHEHSRKGTNSVELVHMTQDNNFGNYMCLSWLYFTFIFCRARCLYFRNETSSTCIRTCSEWESAHIHQSQSPSSQQVADPSTGNVNSQFIASLRHGLCHHHVASPDSVSHLLLFG